MLIIFSCAFWSSIWSSICLLWRNVYLCLIYCVVCFFDFELREQFVYFEYEALISFIACKYFLPFWVLAFCVCVYVCVCLCVFMVSFAVQKLLSLIKSNFLNFIITLRGGSKKILLQFMSKSILPMLSSKSIIVSSLTFRSLIILSLFLYIVSENVLISFFTCSCPLFPVL